MLFTRSFTAENIPPLSEVRVRVAPEIGAASFFTETSIFVVPPEYELPEAEGTTVRSGAGGFIVSFRAVTRLDSTFRFTGLIVGVKPIFVISHSLGRRIEFVIVCIIISRPILPLITC